MRHLLFACMAMLGGLAMSLNSNAQCTTCTEPWGPSQTHIIEQQYPVPSGTCSYTFYYEYRERQCGPKTEIMFGRMGYTSGCHAPGSVHCDVMKAYMLKAFTIDLRTIGQSFVFLTWDCCRTIQVELLGNGDLCFADRFNPPTFGNIGHMLQACGVVGCCVTEFTKISNDQVHYENITTNQVVCDDNTPLPNYVTINCGGKQTSLLVINGPVSCNASCMFGSGVFKTGDVTLDVEDTPTKQLDFDVFPNPAHDVVTISVNIEKAGQRTLQIFDTQGRLVLEKRTEQLGNNKIDLDVSNWTAGIYFIKLTNEATGAVQDKKIEITH